MKRKFDEYSIDVDERISKIEKQNESGEEHGVILYERSSSSTFHFKYYSPEDFDSLEDLDFSTYDKSRLTIQHVKKLPYERLHTSNTWNFYSSFTDVLDKNQVYSSHLDSLKGCFEDEPVLFIILYPSCFFIAFVCYSQIIIGGFLIFDYILFGGRNSDHLFHLYSEDDSSEASSSSAMNLLFTTNLINMINRFR